MLIRLTTLSVLASSLLYLKYFSLYHVMIVGTVGFYILNGNESRYASEKSSLFRRSGIAALIADRPIESFFAFWGGYAALSVLWSPSKALALQYVYYILLIFMLTVIFRHELNTKIRWEKFILFLVFLTLSLNLIGLWEMRTGNHLISDYLNTAGRERIMRYMPGGPFRNPNDFATCLCMLAPYSLLMKDIVSRKWIRAVCLLNILLSAVVIAATSSRANLIAICLLYALYALFRIKIKKGTLVKMAFVFLLFLLVVIWTGYPLSEAFQRISESITPDSIISSAQTEGTSTSLRIALIKNGLLMLRDTAGFGTGAGNHRVLMPIYSSNYNNTGRTTVIHSLFIEILADYGVIVFLGFILMYIRSFQRLVSLYRKTDFYDEKCSAAMLMLANVAFCISSLSSSSLIQLTSLWIHFGVASAFFNIIPQAHSNEKIMVVRTEDS